MSEQPAKDPMTILHDAIAQIASDGSYCAGFVLALEWLEPTGAPSLQVFHTPMTPWHLSGLLEYARDSECHSLVPFCIDDTDDEADED